MSDEHQATIHEIDGKLVLHDPVAAAFIRGVAKHNCRNTYELNRDRIEHFKARLIERGLSPHEAVIVVLNVDDKYGGLLADALMPGHDWQAYRDRGEIPFARGLAMREGIQEAIESFDPDAALELQKLQEVAVVIVDHGVAAIFPA